MALKTRDDLFSEVLVRNNRTTTDAFITDTMLKGWYSDAHVWGSAYHKWPFTEGRVQTTFTTGGGPNSDEWYFEAYKSDSFRMLTIGGKHLTKLNFSDYLLMRENTPDASDRVFSDFGRTIYINPNIDLTGTLVAYGQYTPLIDVTDETGITIFSSYDEEGNEALIEKMTSYLKRREHLPQEAELHDQRAANKLEEVWKRLQNEQYAYQTTPQRDGVFKRMDILSGGFLDDVLKRDQF